MATQVPALKPSVCAEKRQLGDAFIRAVREVMTLQDEELASLARGYDALERFDFGLKLARQKRDGLKKLYLLHIRAHGC